jgi:dephospho-CoA kinase
MAKIVIGLVGQPSAGKGTVAGMLTRIAEESGFTTGICRSRDILKETLDIWHMEADRAHLQKLPEVMVAPNAFGEGALSHAVYGRLLKLQTDIAIADGMRWPSDEKMLRTIPSNLILYVTAEPRLRYERLKGRQGVGEKEKTWEQFLREEKAATEAYIPDFGSRADRKIENNGTQKELETYVREFFADLVLPRLT